MSKLGSGSAGVVIRAVTRDGEDVAVKWFNNPKEWAYELVMYMTMGEHPNLSKFVGSNGLEFTITFEMMDSSLHHHRGPLSVPNKVEVVNSLAAVLCWMHKRNMYHGDVKPPNILVKQMKDGKLKVVIADLGLSGKDGKVAESATQTCIYRHPDAFVKEGCLPISYKTTDVWALGLVLLWLVDQAFPFSYPYQEKNEDFADYESRVFISVCKVFLTVEGSKTRKWDRMLNEKGPSAEQMFAGLRKTGLEFLTQTAEFILKIDNVPTMENVTSKLPELLPKTTPSV